MLSLSWRNVTQRMIDRHWIEGVGEGQFVCTHGAVTAGLLVPVLQERPAVFGRTHKIEIGRLITPAGVAALARAADQP